MSCLFLKKLTTLENLMKKRKRVSSAALEPFIIALVLPAIGLAISLIWRWSSPMENSWHIWLPLALSAIPFIIFFCLGLPISIISGLIEKRAKEVGDRYGCKEKKETEAWKIHKEEAAGWCSKYYLYATTESEGHHLKLKVSWLQFCYAITVDKDQSAEGLILCMYVDDNPQKFAHQIIRMTEKKTLSRIKRIDALLQLRDADICK